MLLALLACVAQAQAGLNINSLFDGRYKHSKNATEIVVTGIKAKAIGLDVYHSISVTDMTHVPAILKALTADGVKSLSKEVEFRSGKLYYGYYVLPRHGGNNRYIFYLNQSLARKQPIDKVTLIYMEGDVSSAHIKKLIRQ